MYNEKTLEELIKKHRSSIRKHKKCKNSYRKRDE